MNLLGGSYRRHKSQHRRNRGDDTQQPTLLAGFVQPYRVAKGEVVRPEHPHAFVHRSRRTPSTCRPNDQLVGRRSCISAGNCHRAGSAPRPRDGDGRLIKRGPRASKNSRRHRAAIHGPAMGTVQVDHQKDVTGFGQRLGRQAGRKIDRVQTLEGRNARSFVLSHPRMTS